MKPSIKKRFTTELQTRISKSFGIDSPSDLCDLNGFENFVYAAEIEGIERVLRIGHNQRRPEIEVRSEIEWLKFLAESNVAVAAPVGEPKVFDDRQGGNFIATIFEKADGARPKPEDLTAGFYKTYGATIGRMHAVTRKFKPSANFSRPAWSKETREIEKFLPEDDPKVQQRAYEVREKIDQLPMTDDCYGLIHHDPHEGNLHWTPNGKMTLFDFDDCVFGHYIYDIAMVFFYSGFSGETRDEKTSLYFRDFMSGYQREHELPLESIAAIPLFMKLREIDLYAVTHRSSYPDPPKETPFMEGRRDSIAEDKPWMDFDFSS